MNPGIIYDPLLQQFLTGCINNGGGFANLHFHLFSSAHTPALSDTLATYTAIESTFAGYAVINLAAASWQPAGVSNHVAQVAHAPATWQLTAGTQQVFGVFVTDVTDSILLAAAADPTQPILTLAQPFYVIVPSFAMQNAA